MEQPVLIVSTDHDFGAPGAPVRLRSSFLGFSDLPHDVGENKLGPAAELHGHTWKLFLFTLMLELEQKSPRKTRPIRRTKLYT